MERMALNSQLRERVARALIRQEGFDPDDGEGLDAWLDHADAVLAALGLDDPTLSVIADRRYSDEFVGNVIRSRFLATEGRDDA